ncbi:MAG TPA: ferritin-like domain-containing protein [Pirellulales bacterium]
MTVASWFSKMTGSGRLDNLEDLLLAQIKDLYSAEDQLISALPKMAAAAHSSQLKSAFSTHLQETKQHKQRLEEVFRLLGKEPEAETCEAMQGLVAEGGEVIDMEGDPEVKDAALIAAAQRVEHYEIAGYGCVRAFAHRLGHTQVVYQLQQTLDEEAHADKLLTEIAEGFINAQAARS